MIFLPVVLIVLIAFLMQLEIWRERPQRFLGLFRDLCNTVFDIYLKFKYDGLLIKWVCLLATPSWCDYSTSLAAMHGKWVKTKDSHH